MLNHEKELESSHGEYVYPPIVFANEKLVDKMSALYNVLKNQDMYNPVKKIPVQFKPISETRDEYRKFIPATMKAVSDFYIPEDVVYPSDYLSRMTLLTNDVDLSEILGSKIIMRAVLPGPGFSLGYQGPSL